MCIRDSLSDAGFVVEEVTTPPVREAAQCWFDVLGSELDTFLGPLAREHGSETIQTFSTGITRWGMLLLLRITGSASRSEPF